MSELIVGAVAEKLVEHALSGVIKKLSRLRAERFFAALIKGLGSGEADDAAAAAAISEAMTSEVKSEVIFEAYRRVCLSASKNVGPTLIGLLTAKVLSEDRCTEDYEDRLLMAAESLHDQELVGLLEFMEQAEKLEGRSTWGTIWVIGVEEQLDSNYPKELDVGPLDLSEQLGVWASKCSGLGIIRQTMTTAQRTYEVDSERHVDIPGVLTTYTWRIGISADLLPLTPLLRAAVSATPHNS